MLLRVAVLFDAYAALHYIQARLLIATRPSSSTKLQRDRAYAAHLEANSRLFQFLQPSPQSSCTTTDERANDKQVQDLNALFVAMNEGQENLKVLTVSASYDDSPGSTYHQNIDR